MANRVRVPLTEKSLNHIQSSKKRSSKPSDWKDITAKLSKNAGQPYISRNGTINPGAGAPSGVSLCSRVLSIFVYNIY